MLRLLKKGKRPMHNRTTSSQGFETQQENVRDGTEATPTNGASAEVTPAMQRAEEMVDRMAERIGHYAGVVGHKFLWLVARAREEAEDIWAEAQELRRQKRQPSAGPAEDRPA
jgi:hypothetical protein